MKPDFDWSSQLFTHKCRWAKSRRVSWVYDTFKQCLLILRLQIRYKSVSIRCWWLESEVFYCWWTRVVKLPLNVYLNFKIVSKRIFYIFYILLLVFLADFFDAVTSNVATREHGNVGHELPSWHGLFRSYKRKLLLARRNMRVFAIFRDV